MKFIRMGAFLLCMLLLMGCQSHWDVRDGFDIELGEEISLDVNTYILDSSSVDVSQVKVQIMDNQLMEGKTYQKVGQYCVRLTYLGENKDVNVNVKDTTKPVFTEDIEDVDLYEGEKLDFTQYSAEDLSEVTINVDDSKVDYTKPGEYQVLIIATDAYNNTTSKEITLTVKKSKLILSDTSKSLDVKDSFVLKATVRGKDNKVTYTSSDTSIVTVSDNGKVTAKKSGTATIIVRANDIEALCKVTVKSTGSQSTTKKNKEHSTSQKDTPSSQTQQTLTQAVKGYRCIGGDCGYYTDWNEFLKHRQESNHESLYNYAIDYEEFDMPKEWE